MKYYIVALFDKDSYEILSPLQKKYTKKYRANRHSPIPHITLNIIEASNIDRIVPIIEKVLSPYKKFKVEYSDNISISEHLRTLNLKINNRGYIKKIYKALTDDFEINNITVKYAPKNDIGVSLATINHFNKDKRNESEVATDCEDSNNTLKIDRIELWKIPQNKKEICLKSFTLKNF